MNFKKTLILAAILGAAVLYLTRVSLPKREYEQQKNSLLTGAKVASLSQIKVERRDYSGAQDETYLLVNKVPVTSSKREEADDLWGKKDLLAVWAEASRPKAALDKPGLEGLFAGLELLKMEGPITESEADTDLSVYGLQSPVLLITAQHSSPTGEVIEAAFGKKNDYLGKRYLKVSGRSGIYLVDESSFAAVNKSFNDLRSKNPVVVEEIDVKSFTIASARGVATVQKDSDATAAWRIMDPYIRPASGVAVSALFDSLRTLRAVDFIDEGSSAFKTYGLSTPKVSVKFLFKEGKDPSSQEIVIGTSSVGGKGAEATYFAVVGSPVIYKASTNDLNPFVLTADGLRERRVLSLKVEEIQKVRATGQNVTPIEIEATDTEWTVNGKQSDPVFVEQLLTDITSLEAVEFTTEPADSSFEKPFLTLVITKKGEKKEEVVLAVGSEVITRSGIRHFVRVGSDGEAVLISDTEAKRIVPHEEALISGNK